MHLNSKKLTKYSIIISFSVILFAVNIFWLSNIISSANIRKIQGSNQIIETLGISPQYIAVFNKTWGGAYDDKFTDIAIDQFGYLYVVGTYSLDQLTHLAYIEKIAPTGEQLWNRTWYVTGAANAYGVAIDNSGNVYMCGTFVSGSVKGFVVKYGALGNQIWNYTIGFGISATYCKSIVVDSSYNVYVGGSYLSVSQSIGLIFKLDINGNNLWNRTYTINNVGIKINSIDIDSFGYIYGVGYTENLSSGERNGYMVKLFENNSPIWNKTWDNYRADELRDVAIFNDTYLYVVGCHNSSISGNFDIFLRKYRLDGTLIWTQDNGYFFNNELANSISIDSYGHIYITGTVQELKQYAFMMIFNETGIMVWDYKISITENNFGSGIAVSKDYEFYVVGCKELPGPHTDFFLLKFRHILKIRRCYDKIEYIEGQSPDPNFIAWTVAGVPGTFIVFNNGSAVDFGKWTSYQNITISITGLSKGTYIFKCWVNDSYGYEAFDEITVIVYESTAERYYSGTEGQFIINSVSIGVYVGASIGGEIAGGITEGASTTTTKLELGIKKPGKYYRRKYFTMYLLSLLIGTGISIGLLFLIYPIALSSTFLVIFGAIIGPIGFFFGTYAFIFVGFYTYRGNLWKAYYKGKTKFFWDVFKWIKIPLLIYSLYSTYNMFMILTQNNITWVSIIFIIIFSSMIGLLLISVFLIIGKKVEVDDLKNKSLEYLKEKKKQQSKTEEEIKKAKTEQAKSKQTKSKQTKNKQTKPAAQPESKQTEDEQTKTEQSKTNKTESKK